MGALAEHRWSGWPGAWCLDCGAPDLREQCLSDHPDDWDPELSTTCTRAGCRNSPCPEPGSKRCDPYEQAEVKP